MYTLCFFFLDLKYFKQNSQTHKQNGAILFNFLETRFF